MYKESLDLRFVVEGNPVATLCCENRVFVHKGEVFPMPVETVSEALRILNSFYGMEKESVEEFASRVFLQPVMNPATLPM